MNMKLDHIVYFTEKTPLQIVEEQRELGWHAVVGGSHEQWGTYNALMYVNNAYIEWLALEDEKVAHLSSNPLVKLYLHDQVAEEGWGTICFSVENIEHFNEKLQHQGYRTSGVLDAERKTRSGAVRRWKMLFIEEEPSETLPYPFFIEWEMTEEERMKVLREEGAIGPENTKLEVTDCLFNVYNPVETTLEWRALLGGEKTEDTVIRLSNCTLKFSEHGQADTKERLADVSIEYREEIQTTLPSENYYGKVNNRKNN